MTNLPVHKACRSRVHSVCTALAVGLSATTVQAGAWEEFQTRCLSPMENVLEIETDGLEVMPDAGAEPGTQFVGTELAGGTYVVVVSLESSEALACGIFSSGDAGAELETKWHAWEREMISSARYVASTTEGLLKLPFLESTFREPRMQVSYLKGTDEDGNLQPIIFVGETDLES